MQIDTILNVASIDYEKTIRQMLPKNYLSVKTVGTVKKGAWQLKSSFIDSQTIAANNLLEGETKELYDLVTNNWNKNLLKLSQRDSTLYSKNQDSLPITHCSLRQALNFRNSKTTLRFLLENENKIIKQEKSNGVIELFNFMVSLDGVNHITKIKTSNVEKVIYHVSHENSFKFMNNTSIYKFDNTNTKTVHDCCNFSNSSLYLYTKLIGKGDHWLVESRYVCAM